MSALPPSPTEIPPLTVPREAVQRFASILQGGRFWMLVLGWVTLVAGVLEALTLVGLVFAWLPIWIGIVVLKAAGRIAEAERTGEAAALAEALAKIRLYFVMTGVMLFVGIVLWLVGFLFFASFLGAMMAAALHHGSAVMPLHHF